MKFHSSKGIEGAGVSLGLLGINWSVQTQLAATCGSLQVAPRT